MPDEKKFPAKQNLDSSASQPDLLGGFDERNERNERRLRERQREKLADRPLSPPSIYLWLCSEGWVRFGPFEWLRFDDESSTISESSGKVVAWRKDLGWNIPSETGWSSGYDERFFITNSPRHPSPSNSNLPRIQPIPQRVRQGIQGFPSSLALYRTPPTP